MVHINHHLIRAWDPDTAYGKAISEGKASEFVSGVRYRFVGLRDLSPILAPLKDGAEIWNGERQMRSVTRVRAFVKPERELLVNGADTSEGWYLAYLVMRSILKGRSLLVRIHWCLVKAPNRKSAYRKALVLGRRRQRASTGRERWRFLGLQCLAPIYEKFRDGSEIVYSQVRVRSMARVKELALPKRKMEALAAKADAVK